MGTKTPNLIFSVQRNRTISPTESRIDSIRRRLTRGKQSRREPQSQYRVSNGDNSNVERLIGITCNLVDGITLPRKLLKQGIWPNEPPNQEPANNRQSWTEAPTCLSIPSRI